MTTLIRGELALRLVVTTVLLSILKVFGLNISWLLIFFPVWIVGMAEAILVVCARAVKDG